MKNVLMIMCLWFVYGCISTKREEGIVKEEVIVDSIHTSQNSLDWHGMYTGEYACEECDAVRIVVNLLDTTYFMRLDYLNEDVQPKRSTGKLTWSHNGSIIELVDATMRPSRFKVGEHRLIPLDLPEEFQGSLAVEEVVLNQLSFELLDTIWELYQLNGNAIKKIPGQTQNITFTSSEGKFYGFGGCNNFRGEFFAQERLISFSRLSSTKMTCNRAKEEDELFTAFRKVDAYEITDGDLILFEGNEVIARFKKAI